MTIEEFIRARLDEEESRAEWSITTWWPSQRITSRDPDSVLRVIAAQRTILAAAERVEENGGWHISGQGVEIIYALAERWNTHPDYQPEWA